jgi:co-chaperonin GroES (HSP10)
MSGKNKKDVDFEDDFAEDSEIEPTFDEIRSDSNLPMRRIHPLGLRVVARVVKESNISSGGLYLPEGAKEATQESLLAQVIEVASAVDSRTDEETNVSGIPLGAMVLIPKTVGVRVPWDEDLRIIDTREVLAVVDEISLT